MYDRNGDGEITVEELGDAMKELGETCTPEDLKEMIKAVDLNGKDRFKRRIKSCRTKLNGVRLIATLERQLSTSVALALVDGVMFGQQFLFLLTRWRNDNESKEILH